MVKTDWAKYAFCWAQRPHIVSRGAQANFSEYAQEVLGVWEKDSDQFNDGYFRTTDGNMIPRDMLEKDRDRDRDRARRRRSDAMWKPGGRN